MYYFFDLLLIGLLFYFLYNMVQTFLLRRGGGTRLAANRDALRETQDLSADVAAQSGMDSAQREQYQDSMTMSVCFARFALQVAYADGHLSQMEMLSILSFFQGAHPSFVRQVQEVLQQDVNHPETIDWDYNLREAKRVLAKPGWHDFSSMIFEGLVRISLSDGILDGNELNIIYGIMAQLGWSRQRMDSWFHNRGGFDNANWQDTGHNQRANPNQGSQTKLEEAFEILGLQANSSPEAIKKRYRELALEHHPDRFAQMGEAMQKTATARFQVIQEAFDYIQKNR